MRLGLVAAIASAALVLSCNSNTGTTPSTAKSPGTTASPAAGGGATDAPMTATVTIQGFAYNPSTITIKKGGTITFKNMDSTAHTVSPESGPTFTDSGNIAPNASVNVTFPNDGAVKYKCTYHSQMHGSVTVVP